MSRVVLLDSDPLAMVSNPDAQPVNQRCRRWMESLLASGVSVKVSAIIDYELRRVLLRYRKTAGLARLDEVIALTGGIVKLDDETILKAAELWAEARLRGKAMANDERLDIDVIHSAHAVLLKEKGYDVEVATPNTRHMSVFTKARQWFAIKPNHP